MKPIMQCANLLVIPLWLLVLLAGCGATTTIDQYRPSEQPIVITEGERIVLLGRRDAADYETDLAYIDCVSEKIQTAGIDVVDGQVFMDAIYPWFEPRTAPKGLVHLRQLLQQPQIRQQIDRQGLRYLVWLDGSTESQDTTGSISCAVGPGVGGCFGFAKWDKLSTYEAVVWDLHSLQEQGRLRVDSEGSSYLIGVVAPIPLLTPVKSDACNGMGNQLKSFFSTQ